MMTSCGERVSAELTQKGACVLSRALAPSRPDFWDPVGFTSDGDVASFKRRRSVELKHGRISMMATMGSLVAVHESWMFDHCVIVPIFAMWISYCWSKLVLVEFSGSF